MASSLTWIDHDPAARERAHRIIQLFQEKESRDELGLGAIRDRFADLLFPGTSTLQTRLRYMLFVPWLYQRLENARTPANRFGDQADKAERDLIEVMRSAEEREAGIVGGRSGRSVKRLPGSVYWAGLGTWGIRRMDWSQDEYHRAIDLVYQRRKAQDELSRERARNRDDGGQRPDPVTITWHPQLPPAPEDFPTRATFQLTVDEASFLRDLLQRAHPQSLLAWLALHGEPAEVDAPWHHPQLTAFSAENQVLLRHGRLFSELMHGAALVYNLALAEAKAWEEKVEMYRERLTAWLEALDRAELSEWSLDTLWKALASPGVTFSTRQFVAHWRALVVGRGARLVDDAEVRALIRQREMHLKGGHSRFKSPKALENWQGGSGLARLTYRWPNAAGLLHDLYTGLGRT